jgi:hypothetical protein
VTALPGHCTAETSSLPPFERQCEVFLDRHARRRPCERILVDTADELRAAMFWPSAYVPSVEAHNSSIWSDESGYYV